MFCPKCGIQNPESGKFCRSCGTDLGNVSDVLTGRLQIEKGCRNSKGKPITLESAATKFFMGLAFVGIAIALAVTGKGGGWWFWMLVPAFMFVGGGIAQFIQVRRFEQGRAQFSAEVGNVLPTAAPNAALPPQQTHFVSAESRYKTGDLVPPSVTDSTTRHLEVNSEGETMTLPKRN
ncbi:MAG TPA: zinc-ribbon domain-containing protein [Pyrinomonadaceae bacterium]|nr:zinc-ribbon domain-containing protein [Pyrinomonadaceae bacterium]